METITAYRQIQLITLQINICSQTVLLPLILGGCLTMGILSFYICISLGSSIYDRIDTAILPIAALDTFITVFVMSTLLSRVNLNSEEILQELKRMTTRGRRACYLSRKQLGMESMKIRLGSNFVDQKTPLIMLSFAVNQIASLLLVS